MTSVVAIQALIFQDGGLVVLGANLFNMAIVGVAVAYMVYRTIYRISGGKQWGIFVGGFIAAWASIELAALACALELTASGTSPANVSIPAMGGIHALIGIGEGLITLGALAFLYATRRALVTAGESSATQGKLVWGAGLAIAFLRAFERSERIYLAMLARGYDGEVRLKPLPPLTRAQWLSLLGGLALFLLILAIGQLLLLLR